MLAPFVHNMDRNKIVDEIRNRMYKKSIVIMVMDITNFEGSQVEEFWEEVNTKKHRLLVVVNKIDALPLGFDVEEL